MTERFEPGEQQRRSLQGEAPDTMENTMMRALLGERPLQQGLEPYQGLYKVREHVNGLQNGRSLGHFVIGDMQMSQFTFALLFPMIEVAPSVSFIEWTVEHFRPDIAPIVPEEAPFAEHRFKTEPRHTKLQRRGTAVSMTANIMNTPEGMARINSMLLKMAATMLNTFEFLTIQMLVTAHDGPMFRTKMALGKYESNELLGQLEYDAARFAAFSRDPSIEMAEDMSDVLRVLGEFVPPPYAVLFPAGTQKNMQATVLERPDTLKVKTMSSDRQILQMESMPSYMRLANGSLAFPVKDHGYGRRGQRAQPLLRSTMIAEHYPMSGVKCDDLAHRTGVQLQGGGFSTTERDIHIYDVKTDKDARISFQHAFGHSDFAPDHYDRQYRDMMLAETAGQYSRESFGPGGKAHPQLFFENGRVQYVEYFGQYRPDIVRPEAHRRVGNTIAAAVRMSKSDAGKHLQKGMRLVRELARAPHDTEFLSTIATIFTGLDQDPSMNPNANIYRQGSTGYGTLTRAQLGEIAQKINVTGTPPYMASLGGLRLLAAIGINNIADGRAVALGMQAKKLLDAARDVYEVLVNVFPNAIAVNPDYRPINHQMPDGFATFFATVFLNSTYRPLILDGVVTPFVVPPLQAGEVATAVIEIGVPGAGAAQQPGFAAIGSALNPLVADQDDAGGMFAGARATDAAPAHARTPWMQHELLRQNQERQGLRAAGRQLREGVADEDDEDEDIFGTARTAFRNAVPAGYGIEGAYQGRGNGQRADRSLGQNRSMDWEGIPSDTGFRKNFDAADVIEDQLVRVCTMAYLTAPCTAMPDFMRMMDANILVPFDILLVRPALELEMYSLLVVAPGIDTAFHAIADTVVDFGRNVDYQMRRLTFSVTHGVVLIAPDHVAILPSRIPRRYIAGGGTQFFENPAQIEWAAEQRPDLISFVVPMDHDVQNVEPAGHIDVDGLHGPNSAARFPGAYEYERTWRLSDQAVASRAMGDHWDTVAEQIPNYTWMGRTLDSNRQLVRSAMGHRRDGSHPGCRMVWMGNKAIFPPTIDTPVSA